MTPERLQHLGELALKRQDHEGPKWDLAFYDLAASPDILPVVYSQRYGYYEEVGLAIVQRLNSLPSPASVLDVGCGVGILTTWYASVFPHMTFRGIDRSLQSVDAAKRHAATLNLSNVEFSCCTLPDDKEPGPYDVIIATQALFQTEIDPGLPSQSWVTFERAQDITAQHATEERTGLGPRLDGLLPCLKPHGVCLLFEKTVHLGRRVLFQRGLMRRGFSMIQKPRYLYYSNLGETERDGPLYIVSRKNHGETDWDESPHTSAIEGLYGCSGQAARFIHSRLDATEHCESWSIDAHGHSLTGAISRVVCGLILGCVREGASARGVVVGGSGDEDVIRDFLTNLRDQASNPESFEQLCSAIWPNPMSSEPLELVPMYENHSPAAQRVWAGLVGDRV